MKQIFALATSLAVASSGFALPIQAATAIPSVQIAKGPVLRVKNDKENPGKGHGKDKDHKKAKGKGHGKDKDHKADKGAKKDKDHKVKAQHDYDHKHARKSRDRTDLDRIAREVLNVQAPKDRDLRVLLGALPLVLLGLDTAYAEIPDDTRLRYLNCPPGLAKKDPPCVPPGLAKQGVTYDQWIDHDDGYYDGLLRDRTRVYRDRDIQPYDDLLLNSTQIANLFNLAPAPYGKRYALIDGMPVLLDTEEYDTLLKVNNLSRVVDLATGVRPAPTAALTQAEMQRLYGLPSPQRGYNYSVVNGEVLSLDDDAFETLQLIRIARAVL
ncbi:transketolase [Pseudosulfitobacter sp. DSM 107133]|uniref:transketolase n=1 Tax=Pseudosulfitobacter sp. DSM 107133 TaxID=2883100 RepID=UPI001F07DE3B|nr:transketolase [Pseudosulfitobacter sp. DSM 107133]UOA26898.1 hypothetical protein DSM107133_01605 [Pseudosulfitobacter sp. DSM 107133]